MESALIIIAILLGVIASVEVVRLFNDVFND